MIKELMVDCKVLEVQAGFAVVLGQFDEKNVSDRFQFNEPIY